MVKTFVDGNARLDALLAKPGIADRVAKIRDRADQEDRARDAATCSLCGRGQLQPGTTECSHPFQP